MKKKMLMCWRRKHRNDDVDGDYNNEASGPYRRLIPIFVVVAVVVVEDENFVANVCFYRNRVVPARCFRLYLDALQLTR